MRNQEKRSEKSAERENQGHTALGTDREDRKRVREGLFFLGASYAVSYIRMKLNMSETH